ncbi:fumarate reductase flavoprotein subunit [Alteromonas sediminis]|uniref:succinate dehydrogenase n=1 Tax=Alteromonas sediminis TaxID=2259342 RepID=A0A3N5Y2N0_9ALTE|nr:fumarate reductase flavoprotein subunit [Alteromonas sediminis]RPJ68177.1 fumarate reductase flavoprotein subunit [Alteromonas sediminis]
MRVEVTDSLIIGGGLAGLRTAIAGKKAGLAVIVLSLIPAKRSHSAAAQGGMQASLASAYKSKGDNEDVHFADTVRGSDWGCDQHVARMFCHVAPKAVRELAIWGVPWNRVAAGKRDVIVNAEKQTIEEAQSDHGLITARDFGGTKKWRTCYTSDGTGHSMLYTMDNKAIELDIPVWERQQALRLIHHQGRCLGAVVRDMITGEIYAIVAKATTIATGGFGRIYEISTNALICDGVGAAMALETELAPLANMEAIQFHPTAIVPAGILTTEGCRGDGGVLRDADGHRFMPDYEPEKAELASRDVVSRRMTEHMRKGKGVKSPYGDHLWLDITLLGREHIEKNLREVKEICEHFLGIDPAVDYIPVRPTQHYSMGGIRTDHRGESIGLKGLFSVGEAACWDLHGFNRLGGNSVAETVVAGMIVGEYIVEHCNANTLQVDTSIIEHFCQQQSLQITNILNRTEGVSAQTLKAQMQRIMSTKVGIFRNQTELQQAYESLQALYQQCDNIAVRNKVSHCNPELEEALRVPKMLKLALCVTLGALKRTESRGAHSREDYPERNDRDWLKRSIYHWRNNQVAISYEDIDVNSMEIPPGSRGYGNANVVEHPETAKRSAEENSPISLDLPERYKAANQRIGDA